MTNKKGTVLIKFYADWCGPCKMMAPVIKEFQEETNIEVIEVNVEKDTKVAAEYGVQSVPTLIKLENGSEVDRHLGYISMPELRKFIE